MCGPRERLTPGPSRTEGRIPFTDGSDFFASVHEDAVNGVVRHIMRQRPSLFNYATPLFHQKPELLCEKIDAADEVVEAGDPLFTEMEALPVLGSPGPLGLNFCIQITEAAIDLHPGKTFGLPPELDPLPEQRFALRARACGGLDCPNPKLIDEITPLIEGYLLEHRQLVVGEVEEGKDGKGKDEKGANKKDDEPPPSRAIGRTGRAMTHLTGEPTRIAPADREKIRPETLPTEKLICFCLELYAVGHFEWGDVPGSGQRWLKTRLDGLEIVDLTPVPMENAIECYLSTVLRLGILPRLIVPTEKMVLDITSVAKENGLELGKTVKLQPAAISAAVPNNPAVEDDQVKVFLDLQITPP